MHLTDYSLTAQCSLRCVPCAFNRYSLTEQCSLMCTMCINTHSLQCSLRPMCIEGTDGTPELLYPSTHWVQLPINPLGTTTHQPTGYNYPSTHWVQLPINPLGTTTHQPTGYNYPSTHWVQLPINPLGTTTHQPTRYNYPSTH